MNRISKEAFGVLKEIIENEKVPEYWANRFESLSTREDSILRGCFKELSEAGMISTQWADNHPYFIRVLKDGYLYEEYIKEEELSAMSQFERELSNLLERAKTIKNRLIPLPSELIWQNIIGQAKIGLTMQRFFSTSFSKTTLLQTE